MNKKNFNKNNQTRELIFPLIEKYLEKQGYVEVKEITAKTSQTSQWVRMAFLIYERENKKVLKIQSTLISVDYILKNDGLGGKYEL